MITRRRKAEKGATMVEFAFSAMIFLTLMFGVIDFGRALYTYHFLSNAAREATRYAAVRGSQCTLDNTCRALNSASGTAGPTTLPDLQQYVQNITPPGIVASQLGVTACGTSDTSNCPSSVPGYCTTTFDHPGCTVEVTVTYKFPFLIALGHGPSINMGSTSEMVIAH